jgi:hypothetical protein
VSRANDVILLTSSTTDRSHNSRVAGDTIVRPLDVDSFDDERIGNVVDQLRAIVQASGAIAPDKSVQEVRRLLAAVVPLLRLGEPHQSKALAAMDQYLRGEAAANLAWKKAIAEAAADAAEPAEVVNRVKKMPFAIVILLKDGDKKLEVLYERRQLAVGDRSYDVPVIANPAKRYVPYLEEAVVLTAAAK